MIEHIIVQAGGRGSRLETLTANKPKCLVPVDNRPMIFHLFEQHPKAKFIIIADYQKETLKKYLNCFAQDFDYEVVDATKKGTCSGLNKALAFVPEESTFMLIWCDLILSDVNMPQSISSNMLGISKDFECRWSFEKGNFIEKASKEHGVAGLFIFQNKKTLANVPHEGEFVAWLSKQKIDFEELPMKGGKELGTMLSYFQNELNKPKSRPFNKIEFDGDIVNKIPLNEQGKKLAQDEVTWYKKVQEVGFTNIPVIYNYSPLSMKRISGENIYVYSFLTPNFKKALLEKIIEALNKLHTTTPAIKAKKEDCESCYITKTFDRLEKVKYLVPFADQEYVTINDKRYKNIFSIKDEIINDVKSYYPEDFHLIHGDCTFSNIMIETDGVEAILFDPRGYFGSTKFYGDIDYDWAKLYYSLVGDYDQFNRKNFSLEIKEKDVELMIMPNHWSYLEDFFFSKTKADPKKIKLLHALIWLSLTTYSWEDYDAICGAFYNGLIQLNEYLNYGK